MFPRRHSCTNVFSLFQVGEDRTGHPSVTFPSSTKRRQGRGTRKRTRAPHHPSPRCPPRPSAPLPPSPSSPTTALDPHVIIITTTLPSTTCITSIVLLLRLVFTNFGVIGMALLHTHVRNLKENV